MAQGMVAGNQSLALGPAPELAVEVPLLSFFTGAGFLDLGFMQAGFKIIWCNEYNRSFVKGYEYGVASLTGREPCKVNTESIVNLGARQIAKEAFGNTPRPGLFGIIGGPPCPDFSVGGKNRGENGEQGRLSKVFVDKILDLQPVFFLYENVPGLIRTAKHREFLRRLLTQLETHYTLDYKVLNALEYGVPQDRERLFVVGFHKKWLKRYFGQLPVLGGWFPWPEPLYPDAKNKYPWPDLSPFGGEPEKPEGIPDELVVGPLICNTEEIARLPNGLEGFRPYSRKFLTIPEGDVSRKSFKRLHRWRYSPTAAYGNNEVHLHPTLPRRLTVREAMRIQTVPDGYALPPDLPLSDKFKMIGNGVPVRLAYAVALSFIKVLRGELNGYV
ncbi:DNA cytosine methyltransferase [Thermanaeromonas toyohensis]|uniref:DNA cytosine methyltransferase n=1 Tax=Thermanaeromonas toyohensis TaxID=161154 RepID=UPI0018D29362|nr:DNA cytosine methyltransferase [Thermanaeromonas toyohensis]